MSMTSVTGIEYMTKIWSIWCKKSAKSFAFWLWKIPINSLWQLGDATPSSMSSWDAVEMPGVAGAFSLPWGTSKEDKEANVLRIL